MERVRGARYNVTGGPSKTIWSLGEAGLQRKETLLSLE